LKFETPLREAPARCPALTVVQIINILTTLKRRFVGKFNLGEVKINFHRVIVIYEKQIARLLQYLSSGCAVHLRVRLVEVAFALAVSFSKYAQLACFPEAAQIFLKLGISLGRVLAVSKVM
jgi:hypothetical protein